jgi:hypothetical protein
MERAFKKTPGFGRRRGSADGTSRKKAVRSRMESRSDIGVALPFHLNVIYGIAQTTVRAVYPRYYPSGAADFFAAHRNRTAILSDIPAKKDISSEKMKQRSGRRPSAAIRSSGWFVLPKYQGKGREKNYGLLRKTDFQPVRQHGIGRVAARAGYIYTARLPPAKVSRNPPAKTAIFCVITI